jgi:hypothetical protein
MLVSTPARTSAPSVVVRRNSSNTAPSVSPAPEKNTYAGDAPMKVHRRPMGDESP